MKEAFEKIYEKERWGKDKGSGTGSSPKYCEKYLAYLHGLLRTHSSVLDLGCGDWQLYQGFDWGATRYRGVDIVSSVVARNRLQYATPNINFHCANFNDPEVLAKAFTHNTTGYDLVLCKDVLQHWSDVEITVWLRAIKKQQFKTLLVTNNWRHFRTPSKDAQPRNVDNQYRWSPINMARYAGFVDVLYYPAGKYKQVARYTHIEDII